MEVIFFETLIDVLKTSPFFLILLYIIWKQSDEIKSWKQKYLDLMELKSKEEKDNLKENVLLLHKVSMILEKYMNNNTI